MQVGESLTVKPDKNVPTSKLPKCKIEGCTNTSWIRGVCADHFHKANGTSYDTYLRNRKDRDEDPKTVAARWTDRRVKRGALVERSKAQDCKQEEPMDDFFEKYGMTSEEYKAAKTYRLESPARVAKRLGKTGTEVPAVETKGLKDEKKPPVSETKPPSNNVGKLEEGKPERPALTPEQEKKQAAYEKEKGFGALPPRAPIGLVGKDYITIVAREEFINKIKEAADREFRTPELQVAYYLARGMEACGA